jgi:hypothetical protein
MIFNIINELNKSISVDHRRGAVFLLLWVVWLLVGTLWYGYANYSDLGMVKGFYMAVNIGYSIGFGYPAEPHTDYHWFSSIYVIMGASFVAVALGFLADKIGEDHDNWFVNMVQQQRYEEAMRKGSFTDKLKESFVQNAASLRAVGLWIVWIGAMILYSMVEIGWTFTEAQYFAISTCSTGGHWSIPEDSPTWMFGLTGFFAALGVPIMGVAMSSIARAMVRHGDMESAKETIEAEVVPDELHMLRKLGLENGDGHIDKAEFIILCIVRMGTDPHLVKFISDRFDSLDDDNGGTLTVEEITKGKYSVRDGMIVPSNRHLEKQTVATEIESTEAASSASSTDSDVEIPAEQA